MDEDGITLAELEREIERLTKEGDELRQLYQDPAQQLARRASRGLVFAQLVESERLDAARLSKVRALCDPDDTWMFRAELLEADGWVRDAHGAWVLPPELRAVAKAQRADGDARGGSVGVNHRTQRRLTNSCSIFNGGFCTRADRYSTLIAAVERGGTRLMSGVYATGVPGITQGIWGDWTP